MTDDFDASLRRRLESLAASVPVQSADTVSAVPQAKVRGTRTSQRLALGRVVPVLAIIVAGVLLTGVLQIGRLTPNTSTGPSTIASQPNEPAQPNEPVSATTRSGDFELSIRSTKSRYTATEPIEIEGAVAYIGGEPSIEVSYVSGGPIRFGIVEPVYGALEISPRVVLTDCGATMTLAPVEPVVERFKKAGLYDSDGPAAASFRAFMLDPELRLPPGTWHLYAVVGFGEICDRESPTVALRAEIEIEVVPATPVGTPDGAAPTHEQPLSSTDPTQRPQGDQGVVGEDDIGDLRLELRSTKAVYATGEAIELSAAYTYLGSEPRIQLAHFSPEMSFAILQLGVANPAVSWAKLYDSACRGLTLERDRPRSVEMTTHSLMQMSAATLPGGFEAMLDEGSLRLPAGRWRIAAGVSTSIGTCEDGGREDRGMNASIEIEVRSNPAPIALATVPDGDGACMEALGFGVLAIDERTGLGWVDPASGPGDVLWPAGFTARYEGGFAVLIDASGRIVAREGDPIRMGGGYVDVDQAWAACELDPFTGTTVNLETATEPEDCRPGIGSRIGTLARAAETGLGVANAAGEITPVRWPFGYSARTAPDRLVLFDADGNVVAWEGAPIGFSEHYADDGILSACADVGRVMASG